MSFCFSYEARKTARKGNFYFDNKYYKGTFSYFFGLEVSEGHDDAALTNGSILRSASELTRLSLLTKCRLICQLE